MGFSTLLFHQGNNLARGGLNEALKLAKNLAGIGFTFRIKISWL